jgi:hypothetical protein
MSKLSAFIVSTVIFIIVLFVTYWLHVTYFPVNVVFYAAIFDGVLATGISFLILHFWRVFRSINGFEKLLIVLIWALGGYAFAISVPTVIDRSLSFYILEKIDQRGGGIREDAMEQVFVEEYMKEHQLVAVRLTEQLESGTIEIENGCVVLTPQGERIVKMSRWFRTNLLPKQRLLLGEYSDALTDPFRNGVGNADYGCSVDEN